MTSAPEPTASSTALPAPGMTDLAFYAGWPRAMSAISLARQLFDGGDAQ